MSSRKSISRTPSAGHDRIEWFDTKRRVHRVRADDAASVADVRPEVMARRPGKWFGQDASQGHYWCAGTQTSVWHESRMELVSMMLFDHLFDIIAVVAQPMLLTFAAGRHHTPDYLIDTAQGERIVLDVHSDDMTADEDVELFELTRVLCERVGWRFELIDRISRVTHWNLEMMARYAHSRYAPDDVTRARILRVARTSPTFGELRRALATPRPGEHLPAVFHLMWNRAIRFDVERPFTDRTRLHAAV